MPDAKVIHLPPAEHETDWPLYDDDDADCDYGATYDCNDPTECSGCGWLGCHRCVRRAAFWSRS